MDLPTEWNSSFFIEIRDFLIDKNIITYVDIGAHIGQSIFFFCHDKLKPTTTISFEPDIENFTKLTKNIKFLNHFIPYNVAIFYGQTDFGVYGMGDNSPSGYFIQELDNPNPISYATKYPNKQFLTNTLEPYLTNIDPSHTFVKIDVEGSEYNILTNSTRLKQCKYLLIEFHFKSQEEIAPIVNRYCLENNFKILKEDLGRHYFLGLQ